MKFLNGWKTILGVAGVVVGTVAPHYVPVLQAADGVVQHGVAIFQGAAFMLTALGIVHKVEKAGQ